MRILFIHASWDDTPEYTINRILAEHADPDRLDCYFVWQDSTHDRTRNHPAHLHRPNHNFYWDFGRNMSLSPKPSKYRRALMMLAHLPRSLLFLAWIIMRIKPDVIYTSQQRFDLRLVEALRLLFPIPLLIHIQYPVGSWLGKAALLTILRTPHMLAVSEFIRQGAIAVGVPPHHIDTILNPANLERFDIPTSHDSRDALRTEFGWAPQAPVIVSAGRLDRSKGHMLLIEAFSKVHQRLPAARLLICGISDQDQGYDILLKRRASELGLDHCVTLAGGRRDLPAIFGGADVFCLPTENDACPLVFAEAMVAGLPVVACRSGGVPEIVVDQQTALLSELGDADCLAANLLTLLCDRDLAMQMGVAGRERALTVFAPTNVAARWTELLYQRFGTVQAQPSKIERLKLRLLLGR